ncbi:NADH:flavin oxidoreductase / NADH oxidase family protein [Sarocladium implicatum]|nr:NADH:flavin oxidoreductase / NADH oxidase family protein [Sarocladium implicatum]
MSKLFQAQDVGGCKLQHRMVMAPLTRYRADDDFVPMDMAKEYYVQRACVPGTMIITEATQISYRCIGRDNAPGIWSEAQIKAWRGITDAVHAKGCYMWCQLWVQGRSANPAVQKRLGVKYMSSSAVSHSADVEAPEEMSEQDILDTIEDYRVAAKNAMEAGFDGVELHGGNGYLPDQFLQDVCNKRADRWGGSIENRARFHIEVLKAIAQEIGPNKTACRLSPWSDFGAMGMEDPVPTFTYLVEQLRAMDLGFLDLIEARISGNEDADCGGDKDVSAFVHAWGKDAPVMLSGGFTPESARHAVDDKYKDYNMAIVFGRHWTSNPDLAFRVKEDIPLVKYNRATFYTPKKAEGYTDWAFSEEFKTSTEAARAA